MAPSGRKCFYNGLKNKETSINEFGKFSQNDIFKKRNIAPLRKISSSYLREQLTFAAVVPPLQS